MKVICAEAQSIVTQGAGISELVTDCGKSSLSPSSFQENCWERGEYSGEHGGKWIFIGLVPVLHRYCSCLGFILTSWSAQDGAESFIPGASEPLLFSAGNVWRVQAQQLGAVFLWADGCMDGWMCTNTNALGGISRGSAGPDSPEIPSSW